MSGGRAKPQRMSSEPAVEPAMADLYHSASGFLAGVTTLGIRLVAPIHHVRDVAMLLDGTQAWRSRWRLLFFPDPSGWVRPLPVPRAPSSWSRPRSASARRCLPSARIRPSRLSIAPRRADCLPIQKALVDGAGTTKALLGQRFPLNPRSQHVHDCLAGLSRRHSRAAGAALAQVLLLRPFREHSSSATASNQRTRHVPVERVAFPYSLGGKWTWAGQGGKNGLGIVTGGREAQLPPKPVPQ